jgi:prophage regulatory protein
LKKPHKSVKNANRRPPLSSTKHFAAAITTPPEDCIVDGDLPRPPRRLIDKAEVLRRVPVSYPTIWLWMRENKFPRSRNIGGKLAWLEAEIEAWINTRPIVPIKGENQQKAEA